MSCIQPGAITPEDLIACADGDCSATVKRHVEQCSQCAADMASYKRFDARLRGSLYRLDCPPAETLGDYELGVVSGSDRVAVARHLRDCPLCADELHTLRAFLNDRSVAQPTTVGVIERITRAIARPVAPLLQQGAALRGGTTSSGRTYRAGAVSIEISQHAETRRGYFAVTGLLWRDDRQDFDWTGTVQLVSRLRATHEAVIESSGTFDLESVADGTYRVAVQLRDQHVIVEQLHVGR